MTRSRRLVLVKAVAFASVLTWLAPAGIARSGIPSMGNSTAPALIRIVGAGFTTGTLAPDTTAGAFLVVVRDVASNPWPGASVSIDLSGCLDIALCLDQLDPDAIVNCGGKSVRKIANSLGEARFTIMGCSTGFGHAFSTGGNARIFGNGALLRSPRAAAFDLDGAGGVGAGDLSVWLADYGSGVGWARSDYDGNGLLGANDLSMWLVVFGAAGSAVSCAVSCP